MRLLALFVLLLTQAKAERIVLKGARIVTVSGGEIETGMILIEDGRIARIAPSFEPPADAKIIELSRSSWVVPGFIDLHSHLGSAFDVEEPTDAVTPQVKAVEAFTSRHRDVRAALGSGVTSVALSPGNGNLIGGRIGVVKLNGERYDRALHRDAVAFKLSLGNEALRRDREPTSRTGALALLREQLSDPNGPLRRLPLFVHVTTPAEIESALDLKEQFKLRMVLVHARGAGRVAERIRAATVPVAFAPLTVSDSKEILASPGRLAREGIPVSFVSDAPATAEEHLRVSAAFAVKYGMDRTAALRGLTLVPATLLGLDKEIGSLEEGKSADLVVWSGDPLSLASDAELVIINGRITHRKGSKP